jgi:hypothetical protein
MENQNQSGELQTSPKVFNYWLIIAGILALTNIASVAYLFLDKEKAQVIDQKEVVLQPVDSDSNSLIDAATSTSKALIENELLVAWHEEPELISDYGKVLDKKLIEFDPDSGFELTLYSLGVVKSGQYSDSPLYLLQFFPGGPSVNANYYFIQKDKQNILITSYSASIDDALPLEKIFSSMENYRLSGLEIPKSIKVADGAELELISNDGHFYLMSSYQVSGDETSDASVVVPLNGVNTGRDLFLQKPSGRIILGNVDGTTRLYGWNLNFFTVNRDESNGYFDIAASAVLQVNWNDGHINDKKYVANSVSGCGGIGYNYADYITSVDQLDVVGKLINGEPIYELKNKTLKVKDSKVSILRDMYDQYYPGYDEKADKEKEKISYDQFMTSHPIVYWQDLFGNYLTFTNDSFQPAVECGKPVIYLYPEKKTDINVQVTPNGGFSFTDPVYNQGGWQVSADSESNIYNYDDKKTYPYLFWEGYGVHYDRPKDGFVVKRTEIKKFLEEKLAYQGLIKKEYNEFIEYWLPRMQAQPYYFITFVPQAQFDLIAPLNIQPKPDTTIRVFMDYEGLSEYKTVVEQKLRKGVRRGYTVIEWGGAKR